MAYRIGPHTASIGTPLQEHLTQGLEYTRLMTPLRDMGLQSLPLQHGHFRIGTKVESDGGAKVNL